MRKSLTTRRLFVLWNSVPALLCVALLTVFVGCKNPETAQSAASANNPKGQVRQWAEGEVTALAKKARPYVEQIVSDAIADTYKGKDLSISAKNELKVKALYEIASKIDEEWKAMERSGNADQVSGCLAEEQIKGMVQVLAKEDKWLIKEPSSEGFRDKFITFGPLDGRKKAGLRAFQSYLDAVLAEMRKDPKAHQVLHPRDTNMSAEEIARLYSCTDRLESENPREPSPVAFNIEKEVERRRSSGQEIVIYTKAAFVRALTGRTLAAINATEYNRHNELDGKGVVKGIPEYCRAHAYSSYTMIPDFDSIGAGEDLAASAENRPPVPMIRNLSWQLNKEIPRQNVFDLIGMCTGLMSRTISVLRLP